MEQSKKDIYWNHRVYVGSEKDLPSGKFKSMDDYGDILNEWLKYIKTLPNYHVEGANNFRDGDIVTGLYELKQESEWYCPKCDAYLCNQQVTFEETHQTCGNDVKVHGFTVAIPLQQPVPTPPAEKFRLSKIADDAVKKQLPEIINESVEEMRAKLNEPLGMNKPTLVERFADNGEHSHWELVNEGGEVLWTEDYKERYSVLARKQIDEIRYSFDCSEDDAISYALESLNAFELITDDQIYNWLHSNHEDMFHKWVLDNQKNRVKLESN